MATHNRIRLVGFLVKDPDILPYPGGTDTSKEGRCFLTIRTTNRRPKSGYSFPRSSGLFQNINVYYDGPGMFEYIKSLQAFDLIDLDGVVMTLSTEKRSKCPICGTINVKDRGTLTFVYPIWLRKIDHLEPLSEGLKKDLMEMPEEVLVNHYTEVSNRGLITGKVMTVPERVLENSKNPCCRYRLQVERKYFIPSQTAQHYDWPYVYSYGDQMEDDLIHLRPGSEILVEGFLRNRYVRNTITCVECGQEYDFMDTASEVVPLSVEYLINYTTVKDIILQKIETPDFLSD